MVPLAPPTAGIDTHNLELALPALGPRYVLSSLVGRGALGEVWAGRTRRGDQALAVKILVPDIAGDPALVARVIQQRRVLTSLSGPNVVGVKDIALQDGTLAIVMELVDGPDLRAFRVAEGKLAPALAASLIAQVCDGLALLHSAGIVHGDLKPENVLLDLRQSGSPVAKVSDFGISDLMYGPEAALIGTPGYLAPELDEENRSSQAADLYAAGIMLYELLAGRRPFAARPQAALRTRHQQMRLPRIPLVSVELWTVLNTLLAEDPLDRPLTAGAVAAHLHGIAARLGDTRTARPRPARVSVTPPSPKVELRAADASPVWEVETLLNVMAPEPAADADAVHEVTGWRRIPLKVALPVAGVVLAAAVGLPLAFGSGGSSHPVAAVVAPPPSTSYSFDPEQYKSGLLVNQRWTLTGDGSHFTADLTAVNTTAKPLTTSFDLAIPKTLAISAVHDVVFNPAPTIVQDDPVVEYSVTLPAGGQQALRYLITVPADGTAIGRLTSWAADLDSTVLPQTAPKATAVHLAALTISPATVGTLEPGDRTQVRLTGTDSAHHAASAAILAGAAWTSSAPAVAAVDQTGTILALSAGTAVITAQVGATVAHISVRVVSAPTARHSRSAAPTHSATHKGTSRSSVSPPKTSAPPATRTTAAPSTSADPTTASSTPISVPSTPVTFPTDPDPSSFDPIASPTDTPVEPTDPPSTTPVDPVTTPEPSDPASSDVTLPFPFPPGA